MANRQHILEHLEQQFGLDRADIEAMLPQFTAAVIEYREDLIKCVPTKDLDAISKKAHRLKGACMTLGIEEAVSVAAGIEIAAKKEDTGYDYDGAMLKLESFLLEIDQ